MYKKFLWVVSAIFLGIFGLKLLQPDKEQIETADTGTPQSTQQAPTSSTPTEFTASFEIYTLGTKRIFADSRYHELSEDVYIPAEDPNIIVVKDPNATWSDLFESLPMSLSKECLITGTNQTFCTNETNQLRFYVNDVEDRDALDRKIKEGDILRVVYE